MNISDNLIDIDDIIMTAKRDKNNKRKFLLVNLIQAKHIPVSPYKTFNLFNKLGKLLYNKYSDEKVFIIGFAETATAVGAAVASVFNKETFYIHTTRENIKSTIDIVNFQEEHSHAIEQKILSDKWNNIIEYIDRIIFVEDEISTGKTILNFIEALKQNQTVNNKIKFTAASVINGMDKFNAEKFENENINLEYLFKIDLGRIENNIENISFNDKLNFKTKLNDKNVKVIDVKGKEDPRKGILFSEYENKCNLFCANIINTFSEIEFKDKNVLVLGTEEFMYPAIKLAEKILNQFNPKSVKTHSTTRSPIIPCNAQNYPIKNRYELISFYDKNRNTFIYNLNSYDKVIVVTDSDYNDYSGIYSLNDALIMSGNKDINFFRWVY